MKTVLLTILALAWTGAPPQKAPVDFSGTYKANPILSKALTESKGLEWKVAGAGGGAPPTPEQMAKSITPTITITQTATHLLIDERLDDYHNKSSLALDGSESVNVSGIRTDKSRTVWKGASLVTTGVVYLELESGEVERPYTTTRTLAPDGNIHVERHGRIPERNTTNVNWGVLERQKKK
jgi:hypothetical protein